MRTLDVALLKIPAARPLEPYEAAAIRGYLCRMFPEEPLLHHHLKNKLLYTYPRVQFKVIKGEAYILGINEGILVIERIKNKINNIKLEKNKIVLFDAEIKMKSEKFGYADDDHAYMFVTIWLALNAGNYQDYVSSNQKKRILKRAMIGNILSMCKGLGYVVNDELKVNLNLEETEATLKGTPMLGFFGKFSINFEIPDYFGIGKSVSRGFGTVKKCNS